MDPIIRQINVEPVVEPVYYKDNQYAFDRVDPELDPNTEMVKLEVLETRSIHICRTTVHPILIQGQCNMTRGHAYEDDRCDGWLFGEKGEGYLMIRDEKGEEWVEEIRPGSKHFIHGKWVRRLINTGNDDLVINLFWDARSKQNYDIVKEHPFKQRVYKLNGTILFV